MTGAETPPVVMFKDLDADDDQEVTEIESLCMNCQENVCALLN